MRRAPVAAALLLALAAGCRHAPPALPQELAATLAARPGSFLTGRVVGLDPAAVLDRQDFCWALAWAPEGARVAYSHLGAHDYRLALWRVLPGPPTPLADVSVNVLDFDLEALAFSPDGTQVATASRDGWVRLWDASSGKALGAVATDEPLSAVAWHPSGRFLVAGGARGLLTALAAPSLAYAGETRGHAAEVRGLAFAPDGTLYSGGWDKRVVAWTSAEAELARDGARVGFAREGASVLVRGNVNGKATLPLALDARLPAQLVLTADAAGAAGIDVPFLQDTVLLPGAIGPTRARLARGQTLTFKGLTLEGVDVAVCDGCVPQGAAGVLGQGFLERVDVTFDEASGEAVLARKGPPPEGAAAAAPRGLALTPRARFTLAEFVNDLSLDAAGKTLGLALSEVKAERTRAIYEAEKRGDFGQQAHGNAGVLLDAASGRELGRWSLHRGVVATAAVSPDGRTLATGGWDRAVFVVGLGQERPAAEVRFGHAVRRARFSPEGRHLGVAAWTPQKIGGDSDPAAVLYGVRYEAPRVQ